MVVIEQEEQSRMSGNKASALTPSLLGKLDEGDGRAPYKAIGRVLFIIAGVCMFLLHDGNGDMKQKDIDYHSLKPAIVWGTIYGVVIKVVDLTQDHGLKMSAAKENLCYLVALLDIYMLCTTAPGGQSFLAYMVVYQVLLKGKADTLNHVMIAAGAYSMWIYLVWKGYLCVDWLFVAITTCISVVWSTLNNRILHMGDTYVNQMRIDVLFLMGNLVAFDYDRFVGPALITVVQHVGYATTKIIAKTQTWYITSKREDLVAKNYLNVELIVCLGAIQWLLAYGLMLWEGFRLGICPWPIILGSYCLVWEFVDGFFDYFNKNSFKTKYIPKRMLHMFWFLADFGLHILFVLYGLGEPFGLTNPETVQSRVLHLVVLSAVWMVGFILCSWCGLSRQIKYFGCGTQCVQQAAMLRLPVYASSPLLMTAAWSSVLGNICYCAKIFSYRCPSPKVVFYSLAFQLTAVGVTSNIFRRQLCEIPTDQFIILTSMWLGIAGITIIVGQHWCKEKNKHEN